MDRCQVMEKVSDVDRITNHVFFVKNPDFLSTGLEHCGQLLV